MRTALLPSLLLFACSSEPGLSPPDLAVALDLSAPVGGDLSAAPPRDLSVPDLAATPDLAHCSGGYLNSDAGNACPLDCSPLVHPVPDEGASHVAFGTPIVYQANPPASGPHWPQPAPWGVHDEVVPREWWVHNLEHQGIVLLYNCPGGDAGAVNGCPDEIALLKLIHDEQPYDQFSEIRIVVTPDPLLPHRFAAVAWDWAYVADSFDKSAIECFVAARYGRGPEQAP